MDRLLRSTFIVGFLAAVTPALSAQQPKQAENIKRIKAATAFVQVGERSGSAFCVHDSGLFVTNEHVIRKADAVTLVLNPGLATQESLSARVLRFDVELDLALLKVDAKIPLTVLSLGSSDGLVEQADVIAAGFPFGKDLALDKGEYPSVSINAGKISSLRLKNGELERIQVDAVVNPGNSGGPVVDAKGNVIGVVVSGIRGATVNFCIPVNHIHAFVGTPEVEVQAPSVAYADRFKTVEFQVKALTILPTKAPYQVELILGRDDRTVAMKFDKGKDVYHAAVEPLRRATGPALLRTTLSYPIGNVTGMVADQPFKIGADEFKLAAVRSLRFGAETVAILTNDQIVRGRLTGLDELSLQLGSDSMRINPTKAVELTIAPKEPDHSVDYTVIVRRGGKELTRVRDTLAFRDAPNAPKTAVEPSKEPQKLDGFWVVTQTESKGKLSWPQSPEEAIYIEGNKMIWVKKDGLLRPNSLEADIEVVAGKNPQQITLSLRRGPANGQKWQVIYKIEGNLLTIATNCDEDRCPTLFTIRATPGGAQFVRTYRRVTE